MKEFCTGVLLDAGRYDRRGPDVPGPRPGLHLCEQCRHVLGALGQQRAWPLPTRSSSNLLHPSSHFGRERERRGSLGCQHWQQQRQRLRGPASASFPHWNAWMACWAAVAAALALGKQLSRTACSASILTFISASWSSGGPVATWSVSPSLATAGGCGSSGATEAILEGGRETRWETKLRTGRPSCTARIAAGSEIRDSG